MFDTHDNFNSCRGKKCCEFNSVAPNSLSHLSTEIIVVQRDFPCNLRFLRNINCQSKQLSYDPPGCDSCSTAVTPFSVSELACWCFVVAFASTKDHAQLRHLPSTLAFKRAFLLLVPDKME